MSLSDLLQTCTDKQASSLHIKVGVPAIIRVHGSLLPLHGPKLGAEDTRSLCFEALSEDQKLSLEGEGEVEGDLTTANGDRFTWCVFRSKKEIAGVFHNAAVVPEKRVETAEEAWAALPHFTPEPPFSYRDIPPVWPANWEAAERREDEPDSGGGAPVVSPLRPTPPVSVGRGAKALPPDPADVNLAAE